MRNKSEDNQARISTIPDLEKPYEREPEYVLRANSSPWSKKEEESVVELTKIYGRDAECIAAHLPNRTEQECEKYWEANAQELWRFCPNATPHYDF